MHKIALSADVLKMIQEERGAGHSFQSLDLRRTAHVIVDLQNGFMEPGAPVEVPVAREIVPNVNRISAAVRARGGRNIFLRMTADAHSPMNWSNWFAHRHSPGRFAALTQAFARNAHYWQLWPALEVANEDLTVDKCRFGAFVPGASALHEILQSHGIDTLIISGTLSNCCCESTARDAMQMNYRIIFVADANAALSDAAHNATLENMAFLFGDVLSTEELLTYVAATAKRDSPRMAVG
ncbi:MAG TPA: cysteine hydrolase [Steroidobacteraceae bacterium]|jgi:ureidoacrylate peracid hydrolase|nr:cysteine hydrolase [Steroidobacteraceae bacterium]